MPVSAPKTADSGIRHALVNTGVRVSVFFSFAPLTGHFFRIRFPESRHRQAETAVCRRTSCSPIRGAGVETSAAGFGAAQAPTAAVPRSGKYGMKFGSVPYLTGGICSVLRTEQIPGITACKGGAPHGKYTLQIPKITNKSGGSS